MLLTTSARSVARVARVPQLTRSVHIENTIGANMPFKYANSNKGALGAKVAVFLISGFSIPFVAAYYQRMKAGGGDAA